MAIKINWLLLTLGLWVLITWILFFDSTWEDTVFVSPQRYFPSPNYVMSMSLKFLSVLNLYKCMWGIVGPMNKTHQPNGQKGGAEKKG